MSALTDAIVPYEANFANSIPLERDEGSKCVVCREKRRPTELVVTSCKHDYCRVCINDMFEHASKDPLSFPPRCCGESIAFTLAQPFLRPEVVDRFKQKDIEYSTRNSTRCHGSKCQELIPADNVDGDSPLAQYAGKRPAPSVNQGHMMVTVPKIQLQGP